MHLVLILDGTDLYRNKSNNNVLRISNTISLSFHFVEIPFKSLIKVQFYRSLRVTLVVNAKLISSPKIRFNVVIASHLEAEMRPSECQIVVELHWSDLHLDLGGYFVEQ